MKNITLTPRGEAVKSILVSTSLFVAMIVIFVFAMWVTSIVSGNTKTTPTINCAVDTVIQPDGTCLAMEK